MIVPKIINISNNALFKKILTPRLLTLDSIFKKHNYSIRICGGAVRDILINKPPNDIDFATEATVDQMVRMFTAEEVRMINNNGMGHGTVTARLDDEENFEITTLRVDKSTDGRHAIVEFVTDWYLDASRRDLTINSMFLDFDGNVIDYHNGYEDIQKRIVKFVGDPKVRICEDYLRILRYFRYLGSISHDGFTSESLAPTLAIIKENASGLAKISIERIISEMKKIMNHQRSAKVLQLMLDCKIFEEINFPMPIRIDNFANIYSKCSDLSPDFGVLLASLLPPSITDPKLLAKLRLSKNSVNIVCFINSNQDAFLKMDKNSRKKFLESQLVLNCNAIETFRSKCAEFCKYFGDRECLEHINSFKCPKLPIKPGEIIEMLSKAQLKMLRPVISELTEMWIQSDYSLDREYLKNEAVRIIESKKSKASAE